MKRVHLLVACMLLVMGTVAAAYAQSPNSTLLRPWSDLEIFRVTSEFKNGLSETVAPGQMVCRFPIAGMANVLASAQVFSEHTQVFFSPRQPRRTDGAEPNRIEITDICQIEQMRIGPTYITSVSFKTADLPAKKGYLTIKINPMPIVEDGVSPTPEMPPAKLMDTIGVWVVPATVINPEQ